MVQTHIRYPRASRPSLYPSTSVGEPAGAATTTRRSQMMSICRRPAAVPTMLSSLTYSKIRCALGLPLRGGRYGPARSRAGRKIPRRTRTRGTSRSLRSPMRRNSPFEGAYLFSTQLGAGLCTNCTAFVGKRTDRDACRRGSCHRRSLTVQPDCSHAAGAVRDRAKMTSGAHLEFHIREQMGPRRVPIVLILQAGTSHRLAFDKAFE